MWSVALKNLRSNLSRFVATLVAISTGVGFLTAGNMLTTSIRNSLGGEVDAQYASVSAAIEPANADREQGLVRAGIDATAIDAIRGVDGVAAAAGEVQGQVALIEDGARVEMSDFTGGIVVRNWIADDALNPLDLESGRAPRAVGEVTVDRGIAEEHGLKPGSRAEMSSSEGQVTVTVVGITAFGTTDAPDPAGTVAAVEPFVFELAGTGLAEYSRIVVTAADDTSDSQLVQRLRAVAPEGTTVVSGDTFRTEAKGDSEDIADFLRWPLWGFSGLALFVCGFVIYNTFSVVVSQRIRELALMRAVAATPRQIRRSLRAEGIGIGLLGSVIGIGLGAALMFVLSRVLVALDLNLPEARIVLTAPMVIVGLLAGTLITALSTFVPAFRAGRTAPVAAMRDAAVESRRASRPRMIIAAVLVVGGVALMLTKNGFALAFGAPLFLIGVLLAGPALATAFSAGSSRVLRHLGMAPRLSADNIARNPKRTSTTINALVIGLFLVTLVTIAGASFKKTAVEKVNEFSSADLIVGANSGTVPSELLDQISGTDGVAAMARIRSLPVREPDDPADPSGPDHPGALTASNPADLDAVGIKAERGSLTDLGDGVAVVDFTQQIDLGDTVTFTDLEGRKIELPVTAILEISVDTFALGSVVSDETLERLSPGLGESGALLRIDQKSLDSASDAIERLTVGYGNISVVEGNIFGQIIGSIFDFIINAVNGLLGMSIVIALIGIVNTLTLSIFERRRELGLLRAVGMTPKEVRHMVGFESVQVALLGTVVGMVSGGVMGWLLIRASEFSEVTLDTSRLAIIFALGIAIGMVAAIVPIVRVSRLDVLDSLAVS